MIDTDRAERACRDVLTVELYAPGMARVITLGGCYTVDARGEGCQCPDKEYHLGPGDLCKHHAAAFLATNDDHPTPFLVVDNVDERTDPAFDLEVPDRIGRNRQLSAFKTDGGECSECSELPGDYPCATCYIFEGAEWPEAMTDGGRDHVDACPECDSTSLRSVVGSGPKAPDSNSDYRCRDCGHRFDSPEIVRRKRRGQTHGLEGAGKRLYEADPDDLMTDGGQVQPAFVVIDHDNDNRRPAETRADAEDMAETAREFGSNDVEIQSLPTGAIPEEKPFETEPVEDDADPQGSSAETTGAQSVDAEIIDHSPDAPDSDAELADLPDKSLSDDPLDWVPGHFVDTIEGVPTINRKGYAVIAEHFDISVTAEPVTRPSESEFEYAEFQAIATTPDGTEYSGWGSAHVDRGDDKTLLAELAETRAMKRATAWATGVGITAVEELKGEVEQ